MAEKAYDVFVADLGSELGDYRVLRRDYELNGLTGDFLGLELTYAQAEALVERFQEAFRAGERSTN